MGLIGAAFGLGFICGPALGGAFSQLSFAAPAFAAATLAALNWLFAFFYLPETYPREKRKAGGKRTEAALSWGSLRHAARPINPKKESKEAP